MFGLGTPTPRPRALKMWLQGTISPNYEWFARVGMLQLAQVLAAGWGSRAGWGSAEGLEFAASILNSPGEAGHPC